ncbi:dihydroneopterin aldolase [Haloglycomyces albus]|uniref:dihydroneopterin aldolase n=1 Tax=Haloglycomyces albus TaxID=526067 RepID=UPI00046D0142|nr:dihydroneopterin aldolase [Haloglycomyces albus]
MSDDVITLKGLRAFGYHGVFDQERREGQEFVVDVELETSLRQAAQTDDVYDTIHYGILADRVAAIVSGTPVNLIETLAERIADMCLVESNATRVAVTVHKPHAPIEHAFTDVSVRIERTRR